MTTDFTLVIGAVLVLACAPLYAADETGDIAPPPAPQEIAPPESEELTVYKTALENAARQIESLQEQLDDARDRVLLLEASLVAAGIDPQSTVDPAVQPTVAADDRAERLRKEQEEARARVQAIRQQRLAEREAQQAAAAARRAMAPQWYYTWQIGYINDGTRDVTYIKQSDDGLVYFRGERSRVDRRNIILRGTFENRAKIAYRYTFDVEVLDDGRVEDYYLSEDGRTLISRQPALTRSSNPSVTRYQTPLLQPGELHQWELPMSVNDSLGIHAVRIVRVRGDAPSDTAVTDLAPASVLQAAAPETPAASTPAEPQTPPAE